MRIAVASGKGGTGKTTVSVGLSQALSKRGITTRLLDADVEEPNCHIFLENQEFQFQEDMKVMVPRLNADLCEGAGECRAFCAFKAISLIGGKPLIFDELCHGCGGCVMVCPNKALYEHYKPIGKISGFDKDNFGFREGRLNIGEATATPLIRELVAKYAHEQSTPEEVSIIDAPPGTSCPVIAVMHKSDYALLVTEPTPFGLNDLKLAVHTAREIGVPFSVVLNRADLGNDELENWCKSEGVEIIMKIPFSVNIAKAYSRAENILSAAPELEEEFIAMFDTIKQRITATRR